MPLALTDPGAYVQPIIQPSPPDAGIPISTAAFIGRTSKGPINTLMIVNSWGDSQNYFGGLDADIAISGQINAFFNNGGGQAVGVRLFHADVEDPEVRQELKPLVGTWRRQRQGGRSQGAACTRREPPAPDASGTPPPAPASTGRFQYTYESPQRPGAAIPRNSPPWSAGTGKSFKWADDVVSHGGAALSKFKLTTGSVESIEL
jgi:hypothetical protein